MLEIKCAPLHVTKTFRLPEEMVESLEHIAAQNNISLNNLVTQCLEYALNNIKTEEIDSSYRRKEK